jgi:hypothetical protein
MSLLWWEHVHWSTFINMLYVTYTSFANYSFRYLNDRLTFTNLHLLVCNEHYVYLSLVLFKDKKTYKCTCIH